VVVAVLMKNLSDAVRIFDEDDAALDDFNSDFGSDAEDADNNCSTDNNNGQGGSHENGNVTFSKEAFCL
jgi:hypothetical protein